MKLIDDIKMWMLSPTDAAVYCYIENSDTNLPYGMLHNMETTAYDPVTKAILRGAMLRHNRRIRGIEMMQRLVNNGKSVQELVEENAKVMAEAEYKGGYAGGSGTVRIYEGRTAGVKFFEDDFGVNNGIFKAGDSVSNIDTGLDTNEEGRYGL